MNDASSPLRGDAIAIVGMAGRFAAADDVAELWQALRDGRELITHYEHHDLLARGVPASVVDHPDYVASRGAITDPLRFDAPFFGYSPREAQLMDPQQRLILETAWHIAEDAGVRSSEMRGPVAVFAATAPATYLRSFPPPSDIDPLEVQLGNDVDFAAARISYKLGLDGPSIGVSTACSSGLTAVHLACQSLMSGDADTAFALAASIRFPADRGLVRVPGSILSSDGHCRPFAADADGTVEADGSAGVLLRRLDDALADGDRIYAVIVGSAIGNDGSNRIGFTAPGVDGQRRIIEAALRYAEVDAAEVGYVEAHGTGTRLGDPVETRALAAVYGAEERTEPCRFGSLKSNVGHLNHVAGIAGLIKVVLSLNYGELAPSLHLMDGLNPDLDLAGGRLRPQTHLESWPDAYPRRIAAVSSFGMGGSGVHMVVTAAPTPSPTITLGTEVPEVLPLSARTPEALATVRTDLVEWLGQNPGADLRDVGYTLREGRTPLPYRTAVLARDHEEAIAALVAAEVTPPPVAARGETVLIFPGQGAEQPGMAADLYQKDEEFRRHLDECLDCLPPGDRVSVRSYMLDADDGGSGTALAQPALFAMEYAKAQCWEAAGLEWAAMIGHSVGEFAAACLAGVFTMEDAMRVVAARGRVVSASGPGAMLAVRLGPAELRDRLRDFDGWDLAAHNADDESVLAGGGLALGAIDAELQAEGVGTMPVQVTHAFHSRQLDSVLPEFAEAVERVARFAPSRPYISCVTGTWVTADQAVSVDHWVRQLRGTVQFASAIRTALADGTSVFVQLGPGQMAASSLRRSRAQAAVVVGEGRLPRSGVAEGWARGATVRWPAGGRRIGLPGYPFQPLDYAFEPAAPAGVRDGQPTLQESLVTPEAPAATNSDARRYPRPPLATAYRPAGNQVETKIVALVEEMLSTSGIGVDDDFFELGWDSLLATSLASRLSLDLELDVDESMVFDAPTAALLASALASLQSRENRGR